MKLLIFTCLMLSPLFLFAQGSMKTLIKAGKLFDSETGKFQSGMAIVIAGNQIESVKLYQEIAAKERKEYKIIDLSNYTLLPGLIDAHTHLLNKETITTDTALEGLDMLKTLTMEGDAYRAIYGSVKAKAYLEAGITAVQDLGDSGQFADIALRKAIDAGLIVGPRMRCAGMGLATEGGQIPGLIYKHRSLVNDEYRIVKGVSDAIQAVRENITQGADVIKIYSHNTPNVTALSIEEMQAIVKEAHRYGRRVTAHATNNQAVYDAVISGVDGIEHGYRVEDSTLVLMAQKGVVLVPTDVDIFTALRYGKLAAPDDPNIEKTILERKKRTAERLRRALKYKVRIVAGSDDYVDVKLPLAEVAKRTLLSYFESGMPITNILQSATINAAYQLNWSKNIGVLKAGFLADIIAVDNDLEQNIKAIMNVHFVMKDGKVYVSN